MYNILNTYKRPIDKEPERDIGVEKSHILAVLTEDRVGNKAVYIGLSDNPDWVAQYGTKLTYEEAVASYYPTLEKDNYRD